MSRPASIAILLLLVQLMAACADEPPAADETSTSTTSGETPSGSMQPPPQSVDDGIPDAQNRTRVWLGVVSEGLYPLNPHFTLNLTAVPAGATITVTYANKDQNPLGKHDWYLDGFDESETQEIETGKETTASFAGPTKPGVYTYYCTVPTHKDRGMVGELKVT